LSPIGVVFYDSDDGFIYAFISFSHDLNVNEAVFNPETDKLIIALAYNDDLQGKTVKFLINCSLASYYLNFSTISLVFLPKLSTIRLSISTSIRKLFTILNFK